jgi:hypothetical protein
MSDSIRRYLLRVSWSIFWRVKRVVRNRALKKAYIILLFFILRFVTLGGRCKAVILHPHFIDQLPVPRGSTEKCYKILTLPVYCFNIHNICHFPFVVPHSIRHWRLVMSVVTSQLFFLRRLFCNCSNRNMFDHICLDIMRPFQATK